MSAVGRIAAMMLLMLGEQGAACAATPPLKNAATSLQVPFVAQDEKLCGGACLAMVMRYWGERGVHAADFTGDLDTPAGITTERLVRAACERGYDAYAFRGTALLLRYYLERGAPLIALIETPGGRLHYVTVVACDAQNITYHDPARIPGITVPLDEFVRVWSRARYWTLVMTPVDDVDIASGATTAVTIAAGPIAAEPVVVPASLQSFRERRWSDAELAAHAEIARDPGDRDAWHVLGASQYMLERRDEALSSWNRAGSPTIDLVQVNGLERTRHSVVTRALGLEDGSVLTAESMQLARRRLDLVPAIEAGRVDYRPVGTGQAEVDVTVLEQPFVPLLSHPVFAGVRALTERRVVASLSSPTGGGEVFEASYRWWEQRPRFEIAVLSPELFGLQGLTRVVAGVEKQTYATSTKELTESTREASIAWMQWLDAQWLGDATAGYNEIRERGSYASLGSSLTHTLADDRLRIRAGLLLWERIDGNERLHARVDATVMHQVPIASSLQLSARAGWSAVDAAAPRFLWPGAGTGHARDGLLRAHPLLESGVVTGDAFAPSLVSAGAELTRWFGAGVLGAAAFVDGACPIVAEHKARFITDAGVGLRVHPPGHRGYFRLDFAAGLTESTYAVSIAWQDAP